MRKPFSLLLFIFASFSLLFVATALLHKSVSSSIAQAQSACCTPPSPPPHAGRWAKNISVRIYISSAFNTGEVNAIIQAFEDWNSANALDNCSGVTFVGYQISDNPPPSSAINVWWVKYTDSPIYSNGVNPSAVTASNGSYPDITGTCDNKTSCYELF